MLPAYPASRAASIFSTHPGKIKVALLAGYCLHRMEALDLCFIMVLSS